MNSSTVTAATAATAQQYNDLREDVVLLGSNLPTSAGAANVQTLALDAQITAYGAPMIVNFIAGYTNTAATTMNVNSLGAKDVKRVGGEALVAGDIVSGTIHILQYNGTYFVLMNPAPRFSEFGDGSDGAVALDGTNTYASFLSKSGGTYTALRDLFISDLVFSNSSILDMAGFQLYVNGEASGTGTIRNNGQNGSNGNVPGSGIYNGDGAAYGGSAGAAGLGITVPRPAASGDGGRGAYQGYSGGANGSNTTISPTTTSGAAGGAGASGGGGGTGGTVGTIAKWLAKAAQRATDWFHFSGSTLTVIEVGPGSGGGGGGGAPGGSGTPHGSGGGGAGGHGGYLFAAIRKISGSITFEAKGGNGGNGGATSSGTVPKGGGGGGGGNGGRIFLMFNSSTGYTTDVTAGSGGTGGVASGGTNGTNGTAGSAGAVVTLQIA